MMLSDFLESAHIMTKSTEQDGYGGVTTTWTEGAAIKAGFVRNNSTEARIAEKNGVKAIWTIVHSDLLDFWQNDCIKRDKTGELFRITGNSRDMETPAVSEMKFRQVGAEVITA